MLLIAGLDDERRAAHAQAPGSVLVASFSGPVTPVLESYVDRTIGDAEQRRGRGGFGAGHARRARSTSPSRSSSA